MKKQVNAFLLLIILVGILFIAGMSVFYQERLSQLGNDYLVASGNYAACSDTLSTAQLDLADANDQLQAYQGDVHKTVSLFEEKKDELSEKQSELVSAQRQIESLEDDVASAKQATKDAKATITERDDEIASLKSQLAALRAEVQDLEDDLEACRGN